MMIFSASKISRLITVNCGTAPDFTPCIPIQEANKRLVSCCQSKNLPSGCTNLCRYDVSQKQIRNALDAGLCGILHVVPILQCASGGHDNTSCCRQKNIAKKSGPQCEIFCRSGDGITGLGLQHLVCNSVLNDLLTCHHAGLTKVL
uniref:DB domain-containing protein n=1 Tax=Syphacia muris TaxID=451379 RepID=A0A0N5ANR3_9BILA